MTQAAATQPQLAEGAALLSGRVAFITGGARGIGQAIAERFIRHGARVALADVDEKSATAAATEMNRHYNGTALPIGVDVTSEHSLQQSVDTVLREFGRLDIAIVNAGILAIAPTVDMDLPTWQRVLEVNLTGAFLTAKVCAKTLIEQGVGGRIIFTGSIMARRGAAQNCAYAASKFGITGLMETMAIELADQGINVTAVNPGQVQTEMIERLFTERAQDVGKTRDEVRDRMLQHIPLGRLAEPYEVADAYVFLASSLSGYITGQSISVEGGWYLV